MSKTISFLNVAGAVFLMSTWVFRIPMLETIGLVLFVPTYIVDVIQEKRIQKFRWSSEKWLYIAFILMFLIAPIWQLFTDSFSDHIYNRILGKRVYFLLFGIVGLLGLNKEIKIKYFAYSMAAVSLFMIAFILIKMDWPYFFSQSAKRWVIAETRVKYFANHLFFNLYLNTALVFIFHTLSRDAHKRWSKSLLIASSVIIILAECTTEGRTGLLVMIAITSIFLFCQIRKRAFRATIIGGLALLCCGYLLLRFGQSFIVKDENSRFALFLKNDRLFTPIATDSNRSILWRHGMDVIKEKPLMGYGISQSRKAFVDKGLDNKAFMESYYESLYLAQHPDPKQKYGAHVHNAFLDIWMQHGIVGLLLLSFIFVYPLVTAPYKNRLTVYLFVIVYACQSAIDILGLAVVIPALAFGLVLVMRDETEASGKGQSMMTDGSISSMPSGA